MVFGHYWHHSDKSGIRHHKYADGEFCMICGKRVSRFLAVRSLESFTPSCVRAGRFSCLTRMPAITSGPIAQPLPASSMPAISVLGSLLRLC